MSKELLNVVSVPAHDTRSGLELVNRSSPFLSHVTFGGGVPTQCQHGDTWEKMVWGRSLLVLPSRPVGGGWGGAEGCSNEHPPFCWKRSISLVLRYIWSIFVYHVTFNDLSCTTFTINHAKFRKRLARTMGKGVALRGVPYSVQSAGAHYIV